MSLGFGYSEIPSSINETSIEHKRNSHQKTQRVPRDGFREGFVHPAMGGGSSEKVKDVHRMMMREGFSGNIDEDEENNYINDRSQAPLDVGHVITSSARPMGAAAIYNPPPNPILSASRTHTSAPSSSGSTSSQTMEYVPDAFDKYVPIGGNKQDVSMNELTQTQLNDAQIREQFSKIAPQNYFRTQPQQQQIYQPMYLQQPVTQTGNLEEKLNYVIHILEEQKNERTKHVAEEIVLYGFLGIFTIFVIDGFARVGRYTR